jgi:solute:Na+ symporter, SSS family
MPVAVGGLLLAVIIAAIVTSTNSFLLSASINLTRDFYKQLTKRNVSSVELMNVGRVAILVFTAISFVLAVLMPDIVTAIVFAYTMYSAGLLVPLYGGYLWKRATAAGGMSSIIGGGGTALLWYVLQEPFGLPPMVPALFVSLALMIIVSLLTKKPTEEQLRVFTSEKQPIRKHPQH